MLAIAVGVAVAAVIAAHLVVGAALPELAFFAATFVAVVGVLVILAIARARRVRPPTPTATLLVVIAVSAAVAATAAFLVQHPTAAEGLPPARAAFLAVALAGCLWLAVAPPRRLGGSRVAPYLGIGAAVLYCLAVLASERANLGELVPLLVFFGPTLMFLVPGLIGAAMGRSFRAGVQAGLWAAIAVLPLSWALGLTEASHQYAVKGEWLFAGDVVNAGFIFGFNLLLFALTPTVGFPFAVVGATAGALNRRTASVPERAS